MRAYQECLAPHGIHAAQILLTAGDFDSRARYLNVRNTILTLFEWGCLPIINENDTVSVAEIQFGDNDHLAAMVTNLLQAPLLVLLTNVDGLYTGDPRPTRRRELLDDGAAHRRRRHGPGRRRRKSALGTGGMRSKLRAARLATAAGESVIMANGARAGRARRDLRRPSRSARCSCRTAARCRPGSAGSGYTARPQGELVVDAGAREAVERKGRSLLPIGVVQVVGPFGKGDVVALCDATGAEFARGLTNYSAADVERIRGLRTEQIAEVLGDVPYEEVVHRDNLVVME